MKYIVSILLVLMVVCFVEFKYVAYAIGVAYEDRDGAEALSWLKWSAELGNTQALVEIGKEYEIDLTIKHDRDEAEKWYRKAAESGSADGETRIARSYRAKKDYTEALKWYHAAAKQGDCGGLVSIGNMYKDGEGVKQDALEAVIWYQRAWQNKCALVREDYLAVRKYEQEQLQKQGH